MVKQGNQSLVALAPDESLFATANIEEIRFPLLISVPHAGRHYPPEIHANLRVPEQHLTRLEDRYADLLVMRAAKAGFPVIAARYARAWVDLNRSAREIDPGMVSGVSSSQFAAPSRKVRGGLGVVPSRLSGIGNLWRKPWDWTAMQQRMVQHHEPYHRAVTELLDRIREKFGGALLLDVHSMPPLDDPENAADIIIGDRFGRSAGSRHAELALAYFTQAEIPARLNHPYAGGYMLERHGRVEQDIHAIQLEFDRRTYLDSALREPGSGLSSMQDHLLGLAQKLAGQIYGQHHLAAAE